MRVESLRRLRGNRGIDLLAAGLVTEGIFLAAVVCLPWWRYGGSLTGWQRILGEGWWVFAACLAAVGVLVAAYLWGWRAIRNEGEVRKIIWVFVALFAGTLFWLLPITSDLFIYLSKAHLFTDLGANPLLDAPLDISADRLIRAYPAFYTREPSIYGPAWSLMSAPGTLGEQDVAVGLFYLKGLAATAYLGCAWLVERILREIRPGSSLEGLYLFAWNPLVLLMAVGDGHNDIVMMAGVLLAVWLLLRERWVFSFGVLALTVWIKYISVIYFPLFALWAWRRLGKDRCGPVLARSGLAAMGVSALVLAPFWRPEWVRLVVERLIWPANWQGGASSVAAWAIGIGLLAFVAGYAVLAWRMVREASRMPVMGQSGVLQRLLDIGFGVSLLAFLLGIARSQPWHLIWPATWAGLSGQRWAWPVLIGLSVVMLVAQVWVEWGTPGIGGFL